MSAAVTTRSAIDHAQQSESDADHECEPEGDRGYRAQDRQSAELGRALLHPQDVERKNVNPMANVFRSTSRSGSAAVGIVEDTRASQDDAPRLDGQQHSVHDQQKEEDRAGEPLPAPLVVVLVEEAHERAVEAPAEEDLGDDLDRTEQTEDAVVAFAERT